MTDLLSSYFKELSKAQYNPLSREEELELLFFAKNGDQQAKTRLIQSYLRYVVYLIKDFNIPDYVDIMDLIQEGTLGLMVGLERFDPVKYPKLRLSTYSTYWIRFFILSYLKTSVKSFQTFATFSSIVSTPDYENKTSEIQDVQEASASTPEQTDSDLTCSFSFDDFLREEIQPYVEKLPGKLRVILQMYFGLPPFTEPYTLKQIAAIIHSSVERVRQLKNLALDNLRQLLIR